MVLLFWVTIVRKNEIAAAEAVAGDAKQKRNKRKGYLLAVMMQYYYRGREKAVSSRYTQHPAHTDSSKVLPVSPFCYCESWFAVQTHKFCLAPSLSPL